MFFSCLNSQGHYSWTFFDFPIEDYSAIKNNIETLNIVSFRGEPLKIL